jgi:hypothetical protein
LPVFIVLTLAVKLAREDIKNSKAKAFANADSTGSTVNVAVGQPSEDAAR